MSPDGRIVANLVDRAVGRARFIDVAESVSAGVAVAAISRVAGLIVAIVYAVWRFRTRRRAAVVQMIERADPRWQNLLVTAEEISEGALRPAAVVQDRVLARAAAHADPTAIHRALPARRAFTAAAIACAAWAVLFAARFWQGEPIPKDERLTSVGSAAPGRAALRISVVLQPPPYLRLPSTTAVDPEKIEVLQGSRIALTIESTAASVTIEHDGATNRVLRGADGRFVASVVASKTGYLSVSPSEGASRTMPIVVSPDALPDVRLTAPGRDLVFDGGSARITFDARATDDHGLRSLGLRYTKVSGSGEQFEFGEGEIPLSVVRTNPRDWHGAVTRSLDDLGLKDGDMLVYRAFAADERPGDGSSSSDAFFVEVSKRGIAAGDAFTLPEEETKYALSQQMLILKTERLQRRGPMPADELTDASLNLAVEQRMIRAEFVFMLGGEVQDEEVEAEQSTELQEGRLQNRGQRDLRAATIAMSQAEKQLTSANLPAALVAERAAVTALQRAFSRDRYILRALASRATLDPTRRLTGDLKDATGWRRMTIPVAEDRRAGQLESLLIGISAASNDPSAPGSAHVAVLARQTVAIDPESAVLRRAAAELQHVADEWSTLGVDVRRRRLEAAGVEVRAEAGRALAGAAFPSAAPALAGPFADALRGRH